MGLGVARGGEGPMELFLAAGEGGADDGGRFLVLPPSEKPRNIPVLCLLASLLFLPADVLLQSGGSLAVPSRRPWEWHCFRSFMLGSCTCSDGTGQIMDVDTARFDLP